MAETETMTIDEISFVVTRNNPGPYRTRRIIRLSSPKFDVVYREGWGITYNPVSTRKWAAVYPDGRLLSNKAGSVRTFGDYKAAIAAALKVPSCHN